MFFSESESAYIFILSYIICMYFAYKYYEKKQYRWKIKSIWYLCLAATPFSLICAFRSINCGYDTYNNINGFYSGKLVPGMEGSIEYIFYACRYAMLLLFGNHRVFLFIMAGIPIVFFTASVTKMAKTVGLCVLGMLFYMLYVSPIMLDQSRQFIAIGISVYALFFLVENRVKPFLLLITIASLCHESALSFFIFILFSNKFVSNNRCLKSFISLIIVLSAFLLNYFMSIIYVFLPSKYLYIELSAIDKTSGNAWVVDVFPMLFSMILYYLFKCDKRKKFFVLELCALSALPFRLGGYISFYIMRMSYYGEVASVLLLIFTLGNLPHRRRVFWTIVSVLVFFIHWYVDFVVLGLNGVIPYSCEI